MVGAVNFFYKSEFKPSILNETPEVVIETEAYGSVKLKISHTKEGNVYVIQISTPFDLELATFEHIQYHKEEYDNQPTAEEASEASFHRFAEEINDYICNFFVICNLCEPSSVSIVKNSYAALEGMNYQIPYFKNDFDIIFEDDNDLAFPKLLSLSLTDTLQYCKTMPGFWGGYSETNVGRALHCFANICSQEHYFEWIFPRYFLWSMIGLEALYGQGNQSMMNQIIQKSAVFLDLPNDTEKLIKEMYSFRSRLFHGDVDLPNKIIFNHPETCKLTKYSKTEFASTKNATHLLILSLQKCIQKNIYNLSFKYELES